MAGDSQVTVGGDTRVFVSDPKCWRVEMPTGGALVVGAAGDATCDEVLCGVTWSAGPLTWRARIAARAKEFDCTDLMVLIGWRGTLWTYDDTALYTLEGKVGAIGTGADYALGFMHASHEPPHCRVRKAVLGSSGRNTYVGGKVRVIST